MFICRWYLWRATFRACCLCAQETSPFSSRGALQLQCQRPESAWSKERPTFSLLYTAWTSKSLPLTPSEFFQLFHKNPMWYVIIGKFHTHGTCYLLVVKTWIFKKGGTGTQLCAKDAVQCQDHWKLRCFTTQFHPVCALYYLSNLIHHDSWWWEWKKSTSQILQLGSSLFDWSHD